MKKKYRYDYMKEFIDMIIYTCHMCKCHIRMTFMSHKKIFKKERNFLNKIIKYMRDLTIIIIIYF